jgi:predicted DNA-binding transcriptional regulator AlpA
MKGGLFPKQIKLSERSSVWILEEIDNWFQEKRNLREEGES